MLVAAEDIRQGSVGGMGGVGGVGGVGVPIRDEKGKKHDVYENLDEDGKHEENINEEPLETTFRIFSPSTVVNGENQKTQGVQTTVVHEKTETTTATQSM